MKKNESFVNFGAMQGVANKVKTALPPKDNRNALNDVTNTKKTSDITDAPAFNSTIDGLKNRLQDFYGENPLPVYTVTNLENKTDVTSDYTEFEELIKKFTESGQSVVAYDPRSKSFETHKSSGIPKIIGKKRPHEK